MIGSLTLLAAMAAGQGLDVEYPMTRDDSGGVPGWFVKIDDVPATRRGRIAFVTFDVPDDTTKDAVVTFRVDSPTGPIPAKLVISTDRDVIAFRGEPTIVGKDYWMVHFKLDHKQLESLAVAKRVEFNLGDVEFSLLYRQIIAIVRLDTKVHGD